MKAAPACLMLIILLSSSFLFSQENVSTNEIKSSENKSKESLSYTSELPKKKLISYTIQSSKTSELPNHTFKKSKTKAKATLEMPETNTSSVPRTTLDFF